MQPVLQDSVAVSRVTALAVIDPERDVRSMSDGIAQGLQPAECGLLGDELYDYLIEPTIRGGAGVPGDVISVVEFFFLWQKVLGTINRMLRKKPNPPSDRAKSSRG